MTITQTVEIPANQRSITIEIPRGIPAGKTILAFTPASEIDDCPICAKHRDPKTGALPYNATTLAAMQEAKDIAFCEEGVVFTRTGSHSDLL